MVMLLGHIWKEVRILELTQTNKKISYRSPSQTNSEFHQFFLNFEKMLQDMNQRKPYLTLGAGDFNQRSSSWWCENINTI